jgi:hypothetical protein
LEPELLVLLISSLGSVLQALLPLLREVLVPLLLPGALEPPLLVLLLGLYHSEEFLVPVRSALSHSVPRHHLFSARRKNNSLELSIQYART